MDFIVKHAKGMGSLFYLVNPYETMFETVEDLPHPSWTEKASPYFLTLVILEHIFLKRAGKPGIRLNDGIMSVAHGMFLMIKEMFLKSILWAGYIYVYDNYRIFELPWDSLWTWIITALMYDLGYYWVHRAAHEVNLLWAAHQVHHSSEEYNLTTALRQSVMQYFGSWPFYVPLAFFIPPAQTMVHAQFNLLYQFWFHTEVVRDLGPLEYILNTAKHHRVHHGSNRYCLDKNYGGVLIIWDRIFNTFEEERPDEKIVYGLVDQPQFFNPLKHQFFYYGKILEKAKSMDNMSDRISAFLKGPGWFPGTPRLGDIEMVPEIQHRKMYDPKVADWVNVYAVLHFVLIFIALDDLAHHNMIMSSGSVVGVSGFLVWTLTSIGMIFDKNQWCWLSELLRGSTFMVIYGYFGAWKDFRIPSLLLYSVFGVSMIIACVNITTSVLSTTKFALKESVAMNGKKKEN